MEVKETTQGELVEDFYLFLVFLNIMCVCVHIISMLPEALTASLQHASTLPARLFL